MFSNRLGLPSAAHRILVLTTAALAVLLVTAASSFAAPASTLETAQEFDESIGTFTAVDNGTSIGARPFFQGEATFDSGELDAVELRLDGTPLEGCRPGGEPTSMPEGSANWACRASFDQESGVDLAGERTLTLWISSDESEDLVQVAEFDVTIDFTGPAGVSVDYPRLATVGPIDVEYDPGTDSAGIIATQLLRYEREADAYDSCPTNDTRFSYVWIESGGFPADITGTPDPYEDADIADDGCYYYVVRSWDSLGNFSNSIGPVLHVDADSSPQLDVTVTAGDFSYYNPASGMLYYNPSNAGSFTVTANASDDEGITEIGFGGAVGWSPDENGAVSTFGGTSAEQFQTYVWPVEANWEGPAIVSATNASMAVTNRAINLEPDNAAPSDVSVNVSGDSWRAADSGPVSVTADIGEDGSGSGISDASLYRATSELASDGSCGDFDNWNEIGTARDGEQLSRYIDREVEISDAAGTCMSFLVQSTDFVGNTEEVFISQDVRIYDQAEYDFDIVADPDNGFFHYDGEAVHVNAAQSGTFKVEATTAIPTLEGLAVYGQAMMDGNTVHETEESPWRLTGIPWDGALVAVDEQFQVEFEPVVSVGDEIDTSIEIPVFADSTAPSGVAITQPNGTRTAGPVELSVTAGTDPAGIRERQVRRWSAMITGGSCGSFGSPVDVGPALATGTVTDNATLTDNTCYQYRVRTTDNVGNSIEVSSGQTLAITSAPGGTLALAETAGGAFQHLNGSTVFYNPAQAGSFTATVTTSGAHPIASVEFPSLTGFTPAGLIDTTAPYALTYAWTAAASAAGAQSITVTDSLGGVVTVPFTMAPDSSAPTGVSITTPATVAGAPLQVTVGTAADAGSGVDTTVVERASAPLTGTTCGTFGAFATFSGSADSAVTQGFCYRYRVTVTDRVGNAATAESTTQVPKPATTGVTRVGGEGNNRFTGTSLPDVMRGGGGNDRLVGGGGNDRLFGGVGDDTIIGGPGKDLLDGGPGDDVINARDTNNAANRDIVRCGPGDDTVRAERNDQVARDCETVIRPPAPRR